jgi:hypothetical protein
VKNAWDVRRIPRVRCTLKDGAIILYERNKGADSESILRSGKHASRTKQWRAL